jgi:hypothetical protein
MYAEEMLKDITRLAEEGRAGTYKASDHSLVAFCVALVAQEVLGRVSRRLLEDGDD